MSIKSLVTGLIKPSIIFESFPDFTDNTKAVYDEMLRQGYGKKYRLVWFSDWDRCATLKNGKAFYWDPNANKSLRDRIRCYSYYRKARCVISCYRFIGSKGYVHGKKLKSFYLSHGTPMKSVKAYYTSPGNVDYLLSPSDSLNDVMAEQFSFRPNQVFAAGFPRNDEFAREKKDLKSIFGLDCSKVIAWLPTYRQHFSNGVVTSSITLPVIHDEEKALELDECLKTENVIVLLKPHPAQDLSLINDLHLSNLHIISDKDLQDHGLNLYQFLNGTDALITDYSSVFFDYLLCDRPIAVVWEDIDEYRQFPGFALDLDHYLRGAEKVYDAEGLSAFVRRIKMGTDTLCKERRETCRECNFSDDGNNAKRVVAFIAEKAEL